MSNTTTYVKMETKTEAEGGSLGNFNAFKIECTYYQQTLQF